MIVTAVEEYTKSKYRIYLNDAFAFVLYRGDLRHFDIAPGKELSDEDLAAIREEVLIKRARLRAMHLLEKRDYTEEAMRRKLRENLYPEDVIEDAVSYVKHYHYIDDRRYVMSFIEAHAAANTAKVIREKLRQKGVDAALIDACLTEYVQENGSREEELLRAQMSRKFRTLPEGEIPYEKKQSLFASFYRKGFPPRLIESVYEELTAQRDPAS